jgi:flagellar motor switch protein FliG
MKWTNQYGDTVFPKLTVTVTLEGTVSMTDLTTIAKDLESMLREDRKLIVQLAAVSSEMVTKTLSRNRRELILVELDSSVSQNSSVVGSEASTAP